MKPACSVDGCEHRAATKGWCDPHYKSWRRYGDPTAAPRRLARRRPRPACQRCGAECVTAGRLFCSYKCAGEAKRGQPKARLVLARRTQQKKGIYRPSCSACGQPFEPRPGATTCSEECYLRSRRRHANARRRLHYEQAVKERQCLACGKMFKPEFVPGQSQRRLCSVACTRIRTHARGMLGTAIRRSRFRLVEMERINRVEIFERDGWRCGICGGVIRRSARAPHPKSPSIDHIIPVARGGAHVKTNVQAAHLGCNSRKHAVGYGQLRLVG